MLRTLWTSRTALNANQEKLNVISNNLANSGTTGYKKESIGFKDLLNETLNRKGYPLEDKSADMGTGVRVTDWYKNYNQGTIQVTGNDTDLCLESITETAYFKVFNNDGQALYTRDGNFKIDSKGQLVDSNGSRVEIQYADGVNAENLKFEKGNIFISAEGNVTIKSDQKYQTIGKINTYKATGDLAFRSVGSNYYAPAEGANVVVANETIIHQGCLEASNVDMAQEMTDMILTQRAFQLNTKSLETADEMWGMINNMSSR